MSESGYGRALRAVLQHLETTQAAALDAAASLITTALQAHGAVFTAGIGHGNEGDWLNRAGGLAALQRFSYTFQVTAPVAECLRDRPRPEPFDREAEAVRLALGASELRAGDVLLVSSVSGRNAGPIELALACREQGIKVIGFTSLEYTRRVASKHPSGKKLFEVVDVVVDNAAPYGDAAVDVPGYDVKLLPVSGVGMIAAGWMIWERVLTSMAAAGEPASVFISANRDGGAEYYAESVERYRQKGF